MKGFFILGTIGFVFFKPLHLHAQTVNQFSGWLGVFGTVKLSGKYSLHVEGNLRSTNEWENVQQSIFRTGLNYAITKTSTLTLGYAYISTRRTVNAVTGYAPEDRIWEQFSNLQRFSVHNHFMSLQNRFRLEQRFIGQSVVENDQLVNDGFAFVQRLRYFVRAIVPFESSPVKQFNKGAFFSLQNEVFVNIGDVSVVNGKFFDQNRAYVSIGYRFSPKNDTEVGYMYQFVEGKGTMKTNNNIIQLATYFRL